MAKLRYLPYAQGRYPLEEQGYTFHLGPTPQVEWKTWDAVSEWCAGMRRKGYYAQAFASGTRIRGVLNFYAFTKPRLPRRWTCPETGEVRHSYRGFQIARNDPHPRLPTYYVSEPGQMREGFSSIDAATTAINKLLDS